MEIGRTEPTILAAILKQNITMEAGNEEEQQQLQSSLCHQLDHMTQHGEGGGGGGGVCLATEGNQLFIYTILWMVGGSHRETSRPTTIIWAVASYRFARLHMCRCG